MEKTGFFCRNSVTVTQFIKQKWNLFVIHWVALCHNTVGQGFPLNCLCGASRPWDIFRSSQELPPPSYVTRLTRWSLRTSTVYQMPIIWNLANTSTGVVTECPLPTSRIRSTSRLNGLFKFPSFVRNLPLWHNGRDTTLHTAVSDSIPGRVGIFTFFRGLQLEGMVQQNLNR